MHACSREFMGEPLPLPLPPYSLLQFTVGELDLGSIILMNL